MRGVPARGGMDKNVFAEKVTNGVAMTDKNVFAGLTVPLVTPFSGGAVDFYALAAHIERVAEGGADNVAVLASTGEAASLTQREKDEILTFCLERAAGMKVIAGVGSACTAEAVGNAKRAEALGADGLLAVTPYYLRPSQTGLVLHFSALAEATRLPVVLYNVPARTGVDMEDGTAAKLSGIPNIVGIKEAADSPERLRERARIASGGFALFCGNDRLTFEALSLGAAGTFSAAANVMPARFKELLVLFERDREAARELFDRMLPVIDALYLETNPVGMKYALSRLGYMKNEVRLPLCPIGKAGAEAIDRAIEKLN